MIYYFITSPISGRNILIGAADALNTYDILQLVGDMSTFDIHGFKTLHVYHTEHGVYSEMEFDMQRFTQQSQIVDIQNLEACSPIERALLVKYVDFTKQGEEMVRVPASVDVEQEETGLSILEQGDTVTIRVAPESIPSVDEKTTVFTSSTENVTQSSRDLVVYHKKVGEYDFLYAIQDKDIDSIISVKDILRNPATADYVCKMLGQNAELFGIFESKAEKPVCNILLPLQFAKEGIADVLEYGELQNKTDPDVWIRVQQDYAEMAEGISVSLDSREITTPYVNLCSLSYIKYAGGDTQAYNKYTELYNSCNPHPQNGLQPLPTKKLNLFIPSYTNICMAYGTAAPLADEDGEDSTASEENIITSYNDLNIGISTECIPITQDYAGTIDFHDCLFYKQAAAIVKPNEAERYIALIEGEPANNDTPISQTELEVFLALRNLVVYDLCREQRKYTLAEINKALGIGFCGATMTKFLKDMLKQAYALNWSHVGDMLEPVATDVLEDDDETIESAYGCFYHVREVPREGGGTTFVKEVDPSEANLETIMGKFQSRISGIDLLTQHLSTNVINSFGYIDAIIRLLRWGELKPSYIYVPSYSVTEGVPTEKASRQYVDIMGGLVSGFSGVWKDTDRTKYSDGAYYLVGGGVNVPITQGYDTQVFSSGVNPGTNMLCGVALQSSYGGTSVTQTDYIDIFTLATGLAEGTIKVHGVAYDQENKTFSITSTPDTSPAGYSPNTVITSNRTDIFSISTSDTNKQRVVIYPSAALMKNYRLISHMFARLNNRAYPTVFDILRDSLLDINLQAVCECADAVTKDIGQVQGVMRKYALDDRAFVEYAVMQSVVNRFIKFQTLFSRTEQTLVDALECALRAEIEYSQEGGSARQTTAIQTSVADMIKQGFAECVYVQCPLTGRPLCYLGKGEKSLAVWREGEFDISGLSVKPVTYTVFLTYLKGIKVSDGMDLMSLINIAFFKNVAPAAKMEAKHKYDSLQKVFLVESNPGTLPEVCKEILLAVKKGK